MTTCSGKHPVNALCLDRKCYLGMKNAYLRLQRRFDRKAAELQRVKGLWEKRVSRGGGAP